MHTIPCERCQQEGKICEYTAGRGRSCYPCVRLKLSCSFNRDFQQHDALSDLAAAVGDQAQATGNLVSCLSQDNLRQEKILQEVARGNASLTREVKKLRRVVERWIRWQMEKEQVTATLGTDEEEEESDEGKVDKGKGRAEDGGSTGDEEEEGEVGEATLGKS